MNKQYVIKNDRNGEFKGKYLLRADLVVSGGGVEWTSDRSKAASFFQRDAVLVSGGLQHCTIHTMLLMEEL